MRFEEAIKALKEGKKIRRKGWYPTHYYQITAGGILVDEDDLPVQLTIFSDCIFDDNWEIVKEPILDKQEKKYLENFLRPYIKRFDKITITKARFYSGDFAIRIGFFAFKDDDDITDSLSLPFFSKNEHMYDGMKLDKCYTLEELGLFEEERK